MFGLLVACTLLYKRRRRRRQRRRERRIWDVLGGHPVSVSEPGALLN